MEAIIVVDVDGESGWKKDYSSGNLETAQRVAEVRENIIKTLQKARCEGKKIIFVTTHLGIRDKNLVQFNLGFEGKCIGCSPEDGLAEFLSHKHSENDEEFEPVFIKTDADAFNNDNLAHYLRKLGVDKVIIMGCHAYACVMFTAAGALCNSFKVRVLENCTYPPFDNRHNDIEWRKEMWIRMVKDEVPLSIPRSELDICFE